MHRVSPMERIDIGVIGAHKDTRAIGVCMREIKLLACITALNAVGHTPSTHNTLAACKWN